MFFTLALIDAGLIAFTIILAMTGLIKRPDEQPVHEKRQDLIDKFEEQAIEDKQNSTAST